MADRYSKNRTKKSEKHNQRTNIVGANFEKGDFIHVGRAQEEGYKVYFKWLGPGRVKKVLSELSYEVESLVDRKQETVHAARLMPYQAHPEGTKVSVDLLRHVKHSEANYEISEKFIDKDGGNDGIIILTE